MPVGITVSLDYDTIFYNLLMDMNFCYMFEGLEVFRQ